MSDSAQQVKLINQALAAAAASIELSRKLLAELTGIPKPAAPAARLSPIIRPVGSLVGTASVPGIVGTFDGENMVGTDGAKYHVPVNYASKTLLVCGDKLKMIDGSVELGASPKPGENSGKIFKQIERVKRQRVNGALSQKDGSWFLTTPEGAYKVLEASVSHFGAKVGDRVIGIIPKDKIGATFAALEGREGQKTEQKEVLAEELTSAKKMSGLKEEVKSVKEVAVAKTELPSKKPSPRVVKVPERVAGVSAVKAGPIKTGKKEETSTPAVKTEKIEKKSEPVISDDDLR